MPEEQPNLTLENCGARTVTKKGVICERYDSLEEISERRHIPKSVLKLASRKRAPGIKGNNSIHWEEIQPYLAENYVQLLAESLRAQDEPTDETAKLETRKLKAEVIKLENFNKAKSKDWISRKTVLRTIHRHYGNLFAQLSRYLVDEQPTKCEGMAANDIKQINKDYLVSLFSQLKHQEDVWTKAEDVQDDDDVSIPVDKDSNADS